MNLLVHQQVHYGACLHVKETWGAIALDQHSPSIVGAVLREHLGNNHCTGNQWCPVHVNHRPNLSSGLSFDMALTCDMFDPTPLIAKRGCRLEMLKTLS